MPGEKLARVNLPIDLGDGLVLRCSTPADTPALVEFHSLVQRDDGLIDQPDERMAAWTSDLLVVPHPTFDPCDFTIVEKISTGKIVSSMNLIPQTWTYGGIPFKVGRPELVSTWPEYRSRGLVRRQFEVIHQWSAERGQILQVISGIPYYYRQFGYEMALNLHGGRAGFPTHIPRLKENEQEPFIFRPATVADIPFLSELYEVGCKRSLVACTWDEATWKYELVGKTEKNVNRAEVRIIETTKGQPAGFMAHPAFSWGDMMQVQHYELAPGFSWLEVTPSVIRYLESMYSRYKPEHSDLPFGAFGFWLGEDHPVYHTIPDKLPRLRRPYAWYLRLADVAGFLRLVAPVLEHRLAGSALSGYNGEVKLTFYRHGLRLVFGKGQLVNAEYWKPSPVANVGNAGFPPYTFLQLLFGYRSLESLKGTFPDCWTDRDEVHVLLATLFPQQPSDIWPVS